VSQSELTIYTDGACSPNPGPGGWGAVILIAGKVCSELSGSSENSTNNRMELTAAVQSLQSLEMKRKIILFTDSQYVKKGITDWIQAWQRNNWRTAGKKDVKNSDLWRQLLEQIERHDIDWRWVKGHGANRWNNRADELAVSARKAVSSKSRPSIDALSANHIQLFTGVTCKHAAGTGAWSVILNWRNHVKLLGQRATGMTANQLYVFAAINGLKSLKKEMPVQVYTHSGYLYEGATSWLAGWQRRNWRTREGSEISNKELWQEFSRLLDRYDVSFFLEDRDNPHCFVQEAKELAREYELGH